MTSRETAWNLSFKQLVEYKRAHGHCNVARQSGPSGELGAWVGKQRVGKKKNKLSAQREEKLKSIGFVWKRIIRRDWDTRLEQLVDYKKANGNCNVSKKESQNVELGNWVANQRQAKNKFLLSEERERKLNSIGFVWNRTEKEDRWDDCFRQLLEYKQVNGDCNVSKKKESKDIQLGNWVAKQRAGKKKSVLSEERERKLNSIGFCWNIVLSSKVDWDVRFRELLLYFQTNGDFNVPLWYPRNPLLASWVSEQRNDYYLTRRGEQTTLTPLREAKLDAIGFSWIVGGTEEEAPPGGTEEDAPIKCVSSAATIRPEEIRSRTKGKSENTGVAVPDSITSV
jgi:hypothetical protein